MLQRERETTTHPVVIPVHRSRLVIFASAAIYYRAAVRAHHIYIHVYRFARQRDDAHFLSLYIHSRVCVCIFLRAMLRRAKQREKRWSSSSSSFCGLPRREMREKRETRQLVQRITFRNNIHDVWKSLLDARFEWSTLFAPSRLYIYIQYTCIIFFIIWWERFFSLPTAIGVFYWYSESSFCLCILLITIESERDRERERISAYSFLCFPLTPSAFFTSLSELSCNSVIIKWRRMLRLCFYKQRAVKFLSSNLRWFSLYITTRTLMLYSSPLLQTMRSCR